MPNTLEAKFSIVTPMFMGGANQEVQEDGIRPPSIKGALRFWWRALNWGRARANAHSDVAALQALHKQEAYLFGSAADKENAGGQGLFLLRSKFHLKPNAVTNNWPLNNTGEGYMAYGIFESGNRTSGNYAPHRIGINEQQEFTVEIVFRPHTATEDVAQITQTLEVFGMCGGLGSRARRGMGSISLLSINTQDQVFSDSNYKQRMGDLIRTFAKVQMPPFTAFSAETRFKPLAEPSADPRRIIGSMGQAFRNHRGQPSELRGKIKIPFGLPLQKADEKNRRSSPLLFHVQALQNQQFIGTVLYLPATPFHKDHQHVNYNVIRDFV